MKPVDSVKDRLASFYHWNDKQALEQAVKICQEQKINLEEVKYWSAQEQCMDKFKEFLIKLRGSGI